MWSLFWAGRNICRKNPFSGHSQWSPQAFKVLSEKMCTVAFAAEVVYKIYVPPPSEKKFRAYQFQFSWPLASVFGKGNVNSPAV